MNVQFLIDGKGSQQRFGGRWRKTFNFPLIVGNKWKDVTSAIPRGGTMEFTYFSDFRVEGIEDITIPAGIFKCYRIYGKMESGGRIIRGGRFWFSPELKTWVKREFDKSFEFTRGYELQNAELISYELK